VEDDIQPLSWAMDPHDSLSDYTIVIHRYSDENADEKTDTYHVHKVVLAVGPRKSKYFERLFKSDASYEESRSHTSHIHLQPSAADTFPILLDYLYYRSYYLKIDSFTAPPLHFLSDYFDVRQMRKEVVVYCQFDLSSSNCHMYYTHAQALNDLAMLRAVERFCVQQSLKVSRNTAMFRVTPAEFWVDVLHLKAKSECPGDRANSSRLLEALLEAKARDGPQGLSYSMLAELTDPTLLPEIETAGAAFAILSWEEFFRHQVRYQRRHRRKSQPAFDDHREPHGYSGLQRRCVEALARILATETPLEVTPVLQTQVLTALRGLNGSLLPLLVTQMAKVISAQVSLVLEASTSSLVFDEEANAEMNGQDQDPSQPDSCGDSRKRKRVDDKPHNSPLQGSN
jgi:hypothetical protein